MSIGAVFIGLALLILSVPIVARPVINKRRDRLSLDKGLEQVETKETYRQTLLALRDLDFDYQLNIVAEDDYAPLRAQLLALAAQAKEEIGDGRGSDLETRIEMAVRARRNGSVPDQTPATNRLTCYQCGAAMEPGDKFCVACGSVAPLLCPQCDRQADPGDKFCSGCGAHLKVRMTV